MRFISILFIFFQLIYSCKKIESTSSTDTNNVTDTKIILEDEITFSTNLDSNNSNVLDTLPLVIKLNSKIPSQGIIYSIKTNWMDSSIDVFKLDTILTSTVLSIKIPGLIRAGTYVTSITLTSKSSTKNSATRIFFIKNKRISSVFLLNIDSIRSNLEVSYKGELDGLNNLGWIIVDLNNDSQLDIFYPYQSTNINQMRPDVFINKEDHFILDNSMLPLGFGSISTRQTCVSDFNRDGLPDLFLANCGVDADPYLGEKNSLLLSNKTNGKYDLGVLPNIAASFWHGCDAGDLNNDGNQDVFVVNAGKGDGGKSKILYGDGYGNFNAVDWYNNDLSTGGFLTIKIVDIDKDGRDDIITAGAEVGPPGRPAFKSTIFFNRDNIFSNKTYICEPDSTGWGQVMDIICDDLDGDGINEIILVRTGDQSNYWYCGYKINFYKSTDGYKTFTDVTSKFIVNASTPKGPQIGWMFKLSLINHNNILLLKGYHNGNSIRFWEQDPVTKVFK